MSAARGWRTTPVLARGLGVGSLGAAAGIWTGRTDVAVAGGALVLAVALAARGGRPTSGARLTATAPRAAAAGDVVALEIRAATPPGAEILAVRLPSPDGHPQGRQRLVAVRTPSTRLERRYPVTGWGSLRLARPDWAAASADGLFVMGPVEVAEVRVAVVPAPSGGGGVAVASRPAGRRGSHRARANGEGTEVLGVREYRPGDLLRRIDWRVSNRRLAARHPAVRQSSLYVRTMVAETDSDVLLLVDTRLDISPDMAAWDLDLSRSPGAEPQGLQRALVIVNGLWRRLVGRGRPAGDLHRPEQSRPPEPAWRPVAAAPGGSLDATVEAAVAVAADHINAGDRVTLLDLGRPRESLPAGAGRRHLDRIRFRLGQVAVDKLGVWRPGSLVPTVTPLVNRVSRQSVAVVISAFYDHEIVELTIQLARSGRPVVALDTAPPSIAPDPRIARSVEALALVAAERRQRMQRLADAGVQVNTWASGPVRDRSSADLLGRPDARGHAPAGTSGRRS